LSRFCGPVPLPDPEPADSRGVDCQPPRRVPRDRAPPPPWAMGPEPGPRCRLDPDLI